MLESLVRKEYTLQEILARLDSLESRIIKLEKSKKSCKMSDQEWMESLKESIAYKGIDIQAEYDKCQKYFPNLPTITRRRFLNWLNRATENKPIVLANKETAKHKEELLGFLKNQNNKSMPHNIGEGAKNLFFSLNRHWQFLQLDVLKGVDIFAPKQEPVDYKSRSGNDL